MFPLIAAVTQWLGIFVFIFWLVSVHVLIVVPCIRFTYMKCLMDESLPLSVAVLKQTVVPVLIRSSAALFLL